MVWAEGLVCAEGPVWAEGATAGGESARRTWGAESCGEAWDARGMVLLDAIMYFRILYVSTRCQEEKGGIWGRRWQ
jgi:hypothetical protein